MADEGQPLSFSSAQASRAGYRSEASYFKWRRTPREHFGTLCLAREEQKTMIIERLKSGVITVGHGRGFVVEGAGERLVITAAHCLPSLPPRQQPGNSSQHGGDSSSRFGSGFSGANWDTAWHPPFIDM